MLEKTKLHDPENFPSVIRAIVPTNFVNESELNDLVAVGKLYDLPVIGGLYQVDESKNAKQDWFAVSYSQTTIEEAEQAIECKIAQELQHEDVIFVLDYMVAELTSGYSKPTSLVASWIWKKPVYSILAKVLYDGKILYRCFLWTKDYNEFASTTRFVSPSKME